MSAPARRRARAIASHALGGLALSLSTQLHLIRRTASDKFSTLQTKPITAWAAEMTQNWDPKRDFAFAMLHAERLTQILTDEAIVEVLLRQAQKHPERRAILERYLERAEPRCRYLNDVIVNTGDRLLQKLNGSEQGQRQQAG